MPAAAHRRKNRCAASDHLPAGTATAAADARDSTAGCAARSRNLLHLHTQLKTQHRDEAKATAGRISNGRRNGAETCYGSYSR